MTLLAEYALTPDVFDPTAYNSEEVCGLHLQNLKDILLHEGLVRNLRNGKWAALFADNQRPWHMKARELLRKLHTQSRLIPFIPMRPATPTSDSEWCDEALGTHRRVPLRGIIVTDRIASGYAAEPIVAPVHRLPSTSWWTSRSPSLRLGRTLLDYRNALGLLLRHANHIMFIDPHLDPSAGRYRHFSALLQDAGNRTPTPLIEIHRVAWFGTSQDRRPRVPELEASFRQHLTAPIKATALSVEVFLWEDLHDRHIISNLVGLGLQNGLDTTTQPNARTTWHRLSRADRDEIQREYDPARRGGALRGRFTIA